MECIITLIIAVSDMVIAIANSSSQVTPILMKVFCRQYISSFALIFNLAALLRLASAIALTTGAYSIKLLAASNAIACLCISFAT